MPPKLPPLGTLDHLKPKADIIPEIFFCGQIVGATDIECEDALLCEMVLETGSYWELIYPGKEKTYQTQTAYAEVHVLSTYRKAKCLFGRIPSIYTSKLMNFRAGI